MSKNGTAIIERRNNVNVKKLCMAALLCAAGVAGSALNIPIGASKCCPMQALVNIISGIFLGPWYAVGMAFVTSLIRNIIGTGSLLAFPGSMFGAFLAGFLYKLLKDKNQTAACILAYLGELFGTGILGAMFAYPIASFVLGKEAALFTYVVPFIISSLGGTIIAVILVTALKKVKILDRFLGNLD